MTNLYFTSTGNCLYVAKQIGGRLFSIPQALKNKEYVFEDEVIGIVFPVYGLCVPPLVEEFLNKVKLKCDYLFAVITYGFFDGGATGHLLEIGSKQGIKFDYINTLKMIENYLPGFEMKKEMAKGEKETLNMNFPELL